MTVSSATARASYLADGVTTVYTAPFRVLDDDHLVVFEIDGQDSTNIATLTLGVDYTVSGVGDENTFISFLILPTSGNKIVILRKTPFTQITDYVDGENFPAESHETALDKLTMMVQQLQEEVDRAVQVNVSGDATTTAGFTTAVLTLDGVILDPAISDPTSRDDGTALQVGDFYFNTASKKIRVYDGSTFVDGTSAPTLSSGIAHTQAGTGASSLDVQTVLRREIYASDFGFSEANTGAQNVVALNAAVTYAATLSASSPSKGARIIIDRGAYEINAAITITADHIHIVGQGRHATTIHSSTDTHDWIVFDGTADAIFGARIEGISFEHRGGSDRTGGIMARFVNCREPMCLFNNFEKSFDAISMESVNRYTIMGNRIDASGRTGTTGGGVGIKQIPLSGGTRGQGFIYDNEIRGGGTTGEARMDDGILVESADGLYVFHNHINGCVNDMRIAPTGVAAENFIGGVFITANYFDKCTENCLVIEGQVQNTYQRINVEGNYFRAPGTTGTTDGDGVKIAITTGNILEACKFNNNIFASCWRVGIACGNAFIRGCTAQNNTFIDNNQSASAVGDILINGEGWHVSGNIHIDGDATNASAYALRLQSTATKTFVEGNNYINSTYQNLIIDLSVGNGTVIKNNAHLASLSEIEDYATVQTLDATVTTLWSYTVPEDEIVMIEAKVTALRDTFASAGAYTIRAAVRRDAGSSTVLIPNASSDTNPEIAGEDAAGYTAIVDVSTNDVRIRVTGLAAATVDWTAKINLLRRSA